jgi:hypothetical protein
MANPLSRTSCFGSLQGTVGMLARLPEGRPSGQGDGARRRPGANADDFRFERREEIETPPRERGGVSQMSDWV